MKKVKPVLRWPGSKYRKIDKIIELLNIKESDNFLDMFGGSGIVGVNVKQLTNATVIINDYDKIFPIKQSYAIKNMVSFQGLGKNFTKSALEYFNRRILNGYWDKLDHYNQVLSECKITHSDFKKFKDMKNSKIYVDPPYDDIKGLYKESFTKQQHTDLRNMLDNLSSFNKILISYNDTPFIRELYKDWTIETLDFTYSSGGGKTNRKVNELIIKNYE